MGMTVDGGQGGGPPSPWSKPQNSVCEQSPKILSFEYSKMKIIQPSCTLAPLVFIIIAITPFTEKKRFAIMNSQTT